MRSKIRSESRREDEEGEVEDDNECLNTESVSRNQVPKMAGNKVKELTVADPSRNLSRILITLPTIYTTKGDGFICLPNEKGNNTIIIVDLPQGVYLGKSVTIKLD